MLHSNNWMFIGSKKVLESANITLNPKELSRTSIWYERLVHLRYRLFNFCTAFYKFWRSKMKYRDKRKKNSSSSMSYLPKYYLGLASDHPFTALWNFACTNTFYYFVCIKQVYFSHTYISSYIVVVTACVYL